jgi:hypothetical protein
MKKKVETQFEAIILFGEMILNNFNRYPKKYDLIHKINFFNRARKSDWVKKWSKELPALQ